MDKELARKAYEYFEENPTSLSAAKQWFENGNFQSVDDAISAASDYREGILYAAREMYLLEGYSAIGKSIKAGTFSPHRDPTNLIVENALREAKQEVQKDDWDNPAYITNAEAVKLADGRITLSRLSKLLASGKFYIRYIKNKKRSRSKVHAEDFRKFIKGVSAFADPFSEEAFESYFSEVELRKKQIQQEKAKVSR